MNNYYTGKTVDDAIEAGLKALGIEKDQAEITVVEEASKGFLGLGSRPAKVLVTKKMNDEDRTVAFLEGLFDVLKVAVAIEVKRGEDERIVIDLMTANSSALIGYRGEVLDSIQTLAGAVYNSGKEDYSRVMVDCENYREKREKTLISLANKLANKALKTGRKVTLEPMNPKKGSFTRRSPTLRALRPSLRAKNPTATSSSFPTATTPLKKSSTSVKRAALTERKAASISAEERAAEATESLIIRVPLPGKNPKKINPSAWEPF